MGLGATADGTGLFSSGRASAKAGGLLAPDAGLNVDEVLKKESLKVPGKSYQATIPDTLDLADRARLAVSFLTHNVDPDYSYYNYQVVSFDPKNPGPDPASRQMDILGKNLRALPWMRTMCGSEEYLDRQYGMMSAMLSNFAPDGMLYLPQTDKFNVKGTTYPSINALSALAGEVQFTLDGNPRWLDWIRLVAGGLERVAIRIDDRAYYPPESTMTREGKWLWNLRGTAVMPYDPPTEPYLEQQGLEGCVKFEQAYAMRALVRACKYAGDKEAMDLLHRLIRFCLKPGMWENTTLEGYQGNEHGIFAGHPHGNTAALLAMLDFAEMEKDNRLKQMVREAYDHSVRYGAARVGWFGGYIMPAKFGRDPSIAHHTEADSLGEMIELGVRLADAGMGEYWDDVDAVVRNQLAEQQLCSPALLREVSHGAPNIEDYVGGFTESSSFTLAPPAMYGCCSANGSIGLYYAWEGITRFGEGVATVNLFLNRASSWMDIDSYLPYEGRVELHNKEARMALVRIPNWVDMKEVKSFVNNSSVHPATSGRYLVFADLQKGETIRLEFPNPDVKEEHTIGGERYQVTLRGSTVVDVDPRPKEPGLISLYQRSQYKAEKAPMSTVRRFAPERILPLQ